MIRKVIFKNLETFFCNDTYEILIRYIDDGDIYLIKKIGKCLNSKSNISVSKYTFTNVQI